VYLSKADSGTKRTEMTLLTTHVLESTHETMSPCTIDGRPGVLTIESGDIVADQDGQIPGQTRGPARRMLRSPDPKWSLAQT
jgi:hypothetical protein